MSDSHRSAALSARRVLVPDGAFTFPVDHTQGTRWFAFLLMPQFTLLAFSSALDPLRIANQLAQKPLYGWEVLSENGAAVQSSSGLSVNTDGGLDRLAPDMQLFVCAGNRAVRPAPDRVLTAIRRHARFGGQVGGIWTGAATLAQAGLLDGRRFTLHWENQPGFIEAFPSLVPSRDRVVSDGPLLTCSGGSAATEMMVKLIERDHGPDFAVAVADMYLNDPTATPGREQRSSIAKGINARNPKLLRVLEAMYAHVEDPLSLDDLARDAQVSRRQLERLFTRYLDEGPATTYRNIRLARARSLLSETNLSVMQVAMATGFDSASTFSRAYRARFGETPHGKRSAARKTTEKGGP